MTSKFHFHSGYFIASLLLLSTEILIALFIDDDFIRPYGGDFVVVILIFCFIKSFINMSSKIVALAVLLFAYAVEISQFYNLVGVLHLRDSKLANVILGNWFSWMDMMVYTLGISFVLLCDFLVRKWRRLPG